MRKRAAKNRLDYTMPPDKDVTIVIPCYGGPYDGEFRPIEVNGQPPPIGYRSFDVRGRKVYLWKTIKVERLDFNVLARASKMQPDDK